jgi:hypothetical protein
MTETMVSVIDVECGATSTDPYFVLSTFSKIMRC